MELRDFCGFTWRGRHSSDFNIVRVSDGSRYNDTILPSFQDTTVKMPGSDGTLYWESFYTNKVFSINIAFDSLTEKNYRDLRNWLNCKDRGELIFDEAPYKAYTVKTQSPPQLKTICFTQDDQRIYKGEGTIQFIAYYPYARSVKKYLNQYAKKDYPNKDEWADSSGLKESNIVLDESNTGFNHYDIVEHNGILLYNPGDLDTDFKLILGFTNQTSEIDIELYIAQQRKNILKINPSIIFEGRRTEQSNEDSITYILIDSATQLIYEAIQTTTNQFIIGQNIYNKAIISGDFFKIPKDCCDKTIILTATNSQLEKIEYDYLYY